MITQAALIGPVCAQGGVGTCERERAASELVQVGLVGDPGVLPLGLHLRVRGHAELDEWVSKK